MYPNPFDRKHSTIRQVIDRLLHPDLNNNSVKKCKLSHGNKKNLQRYDSDSSTSSASRSSHNDGPFAVKVR